jgi:hypothetical protein
MTTADASVAEQLVMACGPYAQARMRVELADWAVRTVDLRATAAMPLSPRLCGVIAQWKWYAADYSAARALVERGIEAAPAPNGLETLLCHAFAVGSLVASGRLHEAGERLPLLREVARASDDVFERNWAFAMLCLADPHVDPGSMATDIAGLEGDFRRTGAPFVGLNLAWCRIQESLWGAGPTDLPGALRLLDAAMVEARSLEDDHVLITLLSTRGAVLLLAGSAELADGLQILDEAVDRRHWMIALTALDGIAMVLAEAGQLGAAEVIWGYLDVNQGLGPWLADRRAALRASAQALADGALMQRRGMAMSRDEVVSFARAMVRRGEEP